MKPRPEQVDALGGCAECQFQPVPADKSLDLVGAGTPGKSVIVVDPTKTDTFIAIELVDTDKKPVPGEAFTAKPQGMTPVTGNLDANGKVRIEGINPGPVEITFPNIDRRDFV